MRRLLILALLLGCDDAPNATPTDAQAPDARWETDARPPDAGTDAAVDAGPDGAVWARPGPRAPEPTVLGRRLGPVIDLARDGDRILALSRTGWLYALDGQGGQTPLRQDLPEGARLLASPAGVMVVHAEGIESIDPGGLRIAALSPRRVVATDDALIWVDAEAGGRAARFPLPEGPLEVIATDLGPVTAIWPGPEGGWIVGVGGDEPRSVLTLTADGTPAGAVESRFVPEQFAALDGALYAHMMTGAGWLERVGPERLDRLAYVSRGFGDLHAAEGALWWHTSATIVRAVPGEPPAAVVAGINPTALLVEPDRLIWASAWREQVLARPWP